MPALLLGQFIFLVPARAAGLVRALLSRVALSILLAVSSAACDRRAEQPIGPTQPTAALTVIGVHPHVAFGGSSVLISGTGFAEGAAVVIGEPAMNVQILDSRRITAATPGIGSGTVDVVVTNVNGETGTLPTGFTFNVVTLTPSVTRVAATTQLNVTWTSVGERCSLDWIGIFEVETSSTILNWWAYTKCGTSGEHTLTAPSKPGTYEFRYLVNDDYYAVAQSAPVVVY